MTIQQAENGAGWEYVGDAMVGVAIQAGRVGANLLREHGEGLTAADLAAATGKTVQAIRASMKTAESRQLVTIKRERQDGTNNYVDRYFLASDKLPL